MTNITTEKEIPLDSLVIGKAQLRSPEAGKGISELAASIRKWGLVIPILVGPAGKAGKYEMIAGRRRFLAHQELKRKTIPAAILDEKVDEQNCTDFAGH